MRAYLAIADVLSLIWGMRWHQTWNLPLESKNTARIALFAVYRFLAA